MACIIQGLKSVLTHIKNPSSTFLCTNVHKCTSEFVHVCVCDLHSAVCEVNKENGFSLSYGNFSHSKSCNKHKYSQRQ